METYTNDIAPVRDRLEDIRQLGVTFPMIAVATGIDEFTLRQVAQGKRSKILCRTHDVVLATLPEMFDEYWHPDASILEDMRNGVYDAQADSMPLVQKAKYVRALVAEGIPRSKVQRLAHISWGNLRRALEKEV